MDTLSANPKNDEERQHNFLISSKSIVGAVWVKNPGPWWIPPGLEYANDPANPLPNYLSPFFGADREYGPEEGWQTVRHSNRSRPRRSRRKTRKYNDEDTEVEPMME
jgi:hypothetical protein